MTQKQHIMHGRDHEHGGADPYRIVWEDAGDCTLLGSADGDLTLTITLDQDVPGTGVLQLVCATVETGLPHGVNDGMTSPDGATDTNANDWFVISSGLPLIGWNRVSIPAAGPADESLCCGSVARSCVAGDLVAGDTVEVVFVPSTGATVASTGLLIWTATTFIAVEQTVNFGGGTLYNNGDIYPVLSSDPTTLNWQTDLGVGFLVIPDLDAHMITAMAAYPAKTGFSPAAGDLVGERSSGSLSIAAACALLPAGGAVDPGGTWPSAASALAGNYQLDTGG